MAIQRTGNLVDFPETLLMVSESSTCLVAHTRHRLREKLCLRRPQMRSKDEDDTHHIITFELHRKRGEKARDIHGRSPFSAKSLALNIVQPYIDEQTLNSSDGEFNYPHLIPNIHCALPRVHLQSPRIFN